MIARVPFNDLTRLHAGLKSEFMAALDQALDSSRFLAGQAASALGEALGELHGCRFVTPVSNGTDALEIAIRALQLPPGSEVLVPSNSYIASATAVVRAGYAVRFADVDAASLLMTAVTAEPCITERTRAIMAVHLYGQVAPMTELVDLAARRGLRVVEDCAQAQGAALAGQPAGSFGHVAAMSFYPGKNLGALGEAGAVLTNDESVADRVSLLANHGSREKYVHETLGFNCRIDEIQAAFLMIKLRHLANWNNERRHISNEFIHALGDIDGITIPTTGSDSLHVRHLFPVLVNDPQGFMTFLLDRFGVETGRHYPIPIHHQGAFRDHPEAGKSIPVAEASCKSTVSLPLFPGMQQSEIGRVITAVQAYFECG